MSGGSIPESDPGLAAPHAVAGAQSYSNEQVFWIGSFNIGTLRQFIRMEDVPDPAGYFVLLEEHPDSINDPTLFHRGPGTLGLDGLAWLIPRAVRQFLFADAHVETHRWERERTVVPVRYQFQGDTVGTGPGFSVGLCPNVHCRTMNPASYGKWGLGGLAGLGLSALWAVGITDLGHG